MSDHDLEKKIGERFDQCCDQFPDSIAPNDKRIRAILDITGGLKGKRVLDVGCGKGRFSKWMIDQGAIVTGVELSENLLKKAQVIPGGVFERGSATKLHFTDNSFDIVICIEVLQHIPDTQKAIREMCRVLSTGGTILIFDRNKYSFLRTIWKKYRESKNRWMYPKNFEFQERLFSPGALSKLIETYCSDVQIHFLGEFIQKGNLLYTTAVRISETIGRIIPILSYNVVWSGNKKG